VDRHGREGPRWVSSILLRSNPEIPTVVSNHLTTDIPVETLKVVTEWLKTRLVECSRNKQKQHFKKEDGLLSFGEGNCGRGFQDHWLDWVIIDEEGGQGKNRHERP
jgi:hypothetical protein